MSLRILHVLDHSIPLHSGYAFRTLSIIRQQRALGWETIHVTSPRQTGAALPLESVNGLEFHRISSREGLLSKLPLGDYLKLILDTRKSVAALIDEFRPDIVHAHSPCLVGIAAQLAAQRSGLPMVYELRALWEDAAVDHGTTTEGSLRYRLSRTLETWLLRRVDAVTVICEGLRSDLLDRGLNGADISVIPNAVDPDVFQFIREPDAALKQRLGLSDAIVLGFIGSFYGYEGLDDLLDALPEILESEPRARVLLVGGGYEEARLHEQVARLGLQEKVVFAGRVEHSEVARYYSVVDLLVYPRKSMRLTELVTPLKPLEAMSQGRLLAATNVGGHRELIQDGRTGFLFKPDDEAALASSVLRILSCRHEWSGIRSSARRFVEEERTWQKSVEKYRPVYSRLLGRPV